MALNINMLRKAHRLYKKKQPKIYSIKTMKKYRILFLIIKWLKTYPYSAAHKKIYKFKALLKYLVLLTNQNYNHQLENPLMLAKFFILALQSSLTKALLKEIKIFQCQKFLKIPTV